METWLAGPMGFEWEHLTPEEADRKVDEALHRHALDFHRDTPKENCPKSLWKDLGHEPA